MGVLWGLALGLLFGIGLIISGMSDPAKVLSFLDLAGHWDPSLAFVMGGATLVTFIGYRLVWRRPQPILEDKFDIPTATRIDGRLAAGAAIFGVGWGVGGFCPGPALTALPLAASGTLIFFPAMLLGLLIGFHLRVRLS